MPRGCYSIFTLLCNDISDIAIEKAILPTNRYHRAAVETEVARGQVKLRRLVSSVKDTEYCNMYDTRRINDNHHSVSKSMDREFIACGVLFDNGVPVWVSAASQSNLGGSYAPLKAATGVKSPSLLSCPGLRESNMRCRPSFRSFGLISFSCHYY